MERHLVKEKKENVIQLSSESTNVRGSNLSSDPEGRSVLDARRKAIKPMDLK